MGKAVIRFRHRLIGFEGCPSGGLFLFAGVMREANERSEFISQSGGELSGKFFTVARNPSAEGLLIKLENSPV
jgi:hypothetical protein